MTAPRPYQEQNIAELLAAVRRRQRAIYSLPTGGGKTFVAAEVIKRFGCTPVVVFVHRRELLRQMSRAIDRAGVAHGTFTADDKAVPSSPVTVASIDTVRSRLAKLRSWLASIRLAVFDECHHIGAGSWQSVLEALAPETAVIGLTATPYRLDGKGLGQWFGHVVKGPSIAELTLAGYLSRAEVRQPPGTPDLARVKKRGGDYAVNELAALFDRPEVTLSAVRHYGRFSPGKPSIAFCVTVDHARHVAEQFTIAGWRAASIDGGMSQGERDRLIAALGDGSLHVLASCELISEGVDVPIVTGAILLRSTLSTGLYLQQVGRVLRPAPGKDRAIVIDCARNAAVHGMPDATRPWSLQHGSAAARDVPIPSRCTTHGCWVLFHGAACPGCGAQARPEAVRSHPAVIGGIQAHVLMALSPSALVSRTRHFTRSEMYALAAMRGFKPGWVHVAERARGGGR